ncbi:DNA-directed DNA polymerase [Tolumonas auensis DSM 9187]|uniref:DNA polymerase IV n=1 Tax=Tolumonas auensis (strain DSM 9187 / NBRC 110442 / TA 4) TaxID=595494 RepID=C4LBJ7_TOLAT|nr:DNA polymerase IV [Tolumonas auensis]ACQ92432.1 DNA-directed DNA polymerase [Tolumonas auensis DSM 9187]
MRKIIHVDMDCFFAAVEMRDNPALVSLPLAIGGSAERRGVIATCNYVARRYGVRSAMATAYALRLCPRLVLLPGRMALYSEVSRQVMRIFARYSQIIEQVSIDEAYLDVSDSTLFQGSATRIAEAIRADIRQELQLTASAGVAPNKFLAKIASEQNKPDGLFVLSPAGVPPFVRQLALSKIPGIGGKTAERLVQLGLHTCADVQQFPRRQLLYLLGKTGLMLLERAYGIDERPLQTSRERKSVGVETTFPIDIVQEEQGHAMLPELLAELSKRLQRREWQGQIARQGVKIKFSDFHQTTVERSVNRFSPQLYDELLHEAWLRGGGKPVRLVGISIGLPEAANVLQLPLDLQ